MILCGIRNIGVAAISSVAAFVLQKIPRENKQDTQNYSVIMKKVQCNYEQKEQPSEVLF